MLKHNLPHTTVVYSWFIILLEVLVAHEEEEVVCKLAPLVCMLK